MENEAPQYMVGELAKKMNVTVRTLQYYDRIGLLHPSGVSEGGRRLYSQQDMVKLHQILSMKYLGFSLEDIKNRILPMDTLEAVSHLLSVQEQSLKQQLEELNQVLETVALLREEVDSMERVNWKKYCDIIELLRQNNSHYWIIKYFDDPVMEKISSRFTPETAAAFIQDLYQLCDQAIILNTQQVPAEDETAQLLAQQWWKLILEFTEGDLSMLPTLMSFHQQRDQWKDSFFQEKWEKANEYIQLALKIYFNKSNINPEIDLPD